MPGVEWATDAGVRGRVRRREWVGRVLRDARHLPARDRLLLEQVYREGRPFTEIAWLTRQSPRLLSRRVALLLRRLRDPAFRFLVERSDCLPREVAMTATRVLVQGHSLRGAAALARCPLHRVRQHLAAVRVLVRVMR